LIEYKISRGSWDTEAVKKDGSVYHNFELEVLRDTTITIRIQNWKDLKK